MPTNPNEFPRGKDMPRQSPIYWAQQKDRYLRQLLISDIEEDTDRDLIVYYARMDDAGGQIHAEDINYLAEILRDRKKESFDLFLHTPGGFTDATEGILNLLQSQKAGYRVIVPAMAKSNGTVLALSAETILMGSASQLGPIDPSLGGTPAYFVKKIYEEQAKNPSLPPAIDPLVYHLATYAIMQTQKMAREVLTAGMMRGKDPADIEDVVKKLSDRETFHSHGSVVNILEARKFGLNVTELADTDPLWQKMWMLHTILDQDTRSKGLAKIFEGARLSHALSSST